MELEIPVMLAKMNNGDEREESTGSLDEAVQTIRNDTLHIEVPEFYYIPERYGI